MMSIPSENNGKFRDACLNVRWFVDLAAARRSIEAWWIHYNRVCPHSPLGESQGTLLN